MTTDGENGQGSADEMAALRRRADELSQRVEELTAALAQARADEQALRATQARFQALATCAPVGMFYSDREGNNSFVNDRWSMLTGVPSADGLGTGWTVAIHPEDRERVYAEWYAANRERREFSLDYRFVTGEGKVIWVSGRAAPLHDQAGEVTGYVGTISDISAIKRAEEVLRQSLRQQEIIDAQRIALMELSTPLVPINEQIVVMPLIGIVDSMRAQQVMQTLLTGISKSRARIAILDITGVSTVDTQVANALIQASKAVRLLGAQMVLTGIRPEVAQTLITIGTDLQGIVTCGNLEAGIAYAMSASQGGAARAG